MEELYMKRKHIPAFGSWDYSDYDLPFTQCFETVTNPEGLIHHYNYCEEESDLYVAGDLYENDVVTPAMIVVPRRPKARKRTARFPKEKGEKKGGSCGGGGGGEWVVGEYESYQVKEQPSRVVSISTPSRKKAIVVPKAVDEDLYKISPDLLRAQYKNKKKARGWFFSSCLRGTCIS